MSSRILLLCLAQTLKQKGNVISVYWWLYASSFPPLSRLCCMRYNDVLRRAATVYFPFALQVHVILTCGLCNLQYYSLIFMFFCWYWFNNSYAWTKLPTFRIRISVHFRFLAFYIGIPYNEMQLSLDIMLYCRILWWCLWNVISQSIIWQMLWLCLLSKQALTLFKIFREVLSSDTQN